MQSTLIVTELVSIGHRFGRVMTLSALLKWQLLGLMTVDEASNQPLFGHFTQFVVEIQRSLQYNLQFLHHQACLSLQLCAVARDVKVDLA